MRFCWLGLFLFIATLGLKTVWPESRVNLPLVDVRDVALLEDTLILKTGAEEICIMDQKPVKSEVCINHPCCWRGWWIYPAAEGMVAVKDPWWPLAALGGLLALVGAIWRCVCPKR